MKTQKYFLTSIFMILLSIFSLIYFEGSFISRCILGTQQGYSEPISWYLFVILAVVGIVFFVLGWVVKDKPKPPRDTENDKDTKK